MRIIGQIFEEWDYDKFFRLPDNRDVSTDRLNKLVASISDKYVLNPIIVNEKMEIIDGQGRYEALKKLRKPIHYLIAPGATSADCRRMNKYNTKWSSLDFAKSFANSGKTAYKTLLSTLDETGLSIKITLRLTNNNALHKEGGTSVFEQGGLTFAETDRARVKKIKAIAQDVADALRLTERLSDTFYTGVKISCEWDGYDHKRMCKNAAINRSTYATAASLGAQLKALEEIYNYKSRAENRLYFSDYMRSSGAATRDYDKGVATRYNRLYKGDDVSTLKPSK